MIACPNFSNPEVAREFEELKNATSEKAAYHIWSANNGNSIDKAPNGAESVLFKNLLELTQGNIVDAIRLKSNIYKNSFKKWFSGDGKFDDTKDFFTSEGEPWSDVLIRGKETSESNTELNKGDNKSILKSIHKGAAKIIANQDLDSLITNSGKPYSAIALLKQLEALTEDNTTKEYINKIYKYFQNNGDISIYKTKFDFAENTNLFGFYYPGDNSGVIFIRDDINIKNGLQVLLHELVHAATSRALYTDENMEKSIDKYISLLEESMSNDKEEQKSSKSIYGFTNAHEFIAEFVSNPEFAELLHTIPSIESDKFKSAFEHIWNYILTLLGFEPKSSYEQIKPIVDTIFDLQNKIGFIEQPYSDKNIKSVSVSRDESDNDILNTVFEEGLMPINQFTPVGESSILLGNNFNALSSGSAVSSSDVLNDILSNDAISQSQRELTEMLIKHDIPVKFGNLPFGKLAETVTTEDSSIIILDEKQLKGLSHGYVTTVILHEIIHALTVNTLNNPKTKEERIFAKSINKLTNKAKKLFSKYRQLDSDDVAYALSNEKEFAAMFITDDSIRTEILDLLNKDNSLLSTVKHFVNSLTKFLVNKNVFNTTEEKIKAAQKKFLHFLDSQTEKDDSKSIISKNGLLSTLNHLNYNTVLTQAVYEQLKYIRTQKNIERNNLKSFSEKRNLKDVRTVSFESISNMLGIRVNAIRTSSLEQSEKIKELNATRSQIEMLNSSTVSKYHAITSILQQVIPDILDQLDKFDEINESGKTIDSKEYMFQMHSNIGMYNEVAKTLDELLKNVSNRKDIIQDFKSKVKDSEPITNDDLQEIHQDVQRLVSVTTTGISTLNILLKRLVISELEKVANKTNSVALLDYIDKINSTEQFLDDDVSFLEQYLGSADSSANEIIRIIAYLVTKANHDADIEASEKMLKLSKLAADLQVGESLQDLYELDEDGLPTGRFVAQLNYGNFQKADKSNILEVNRAINKKYNLRLEDDNRVPPKENSEAFKEWQKLRNDWKKKHTDRKFIDEYYDAWAKVDYFTKEALSSHNEAINSILNKPGVKDENGNIHLDKLSDDDFEQLEKLRRNKQLLYSDYDFFGNKKIEGTVEYEIAKQLQQLRTDLDNIRKKHGQDPKKSVTKNTKDWQIAFDAIVEQCGGKAEFSKWQRGEDNEFDEVTFNKWNSRNSQLVFKKDENGDAIVFKEIERIMHAQNIDYGEEYNNLKERSDQLLKPFKSPNGEVNNELMPESVKNLLNQIYEQMYQIRRKKISESKSLKSLSDKYKEVFSKFIEFVDTDYYKDLQTKLWEAADNDYNLYQAMLYGYGNINVNYITLLEEFSPYKWLQKAQAIDKEKYMEYQPNQYWIEKTEDNALLNKNFHEDGTGRSELPKHNVYDNSKQYNKIKKNPRLNALYEACLEVMEFANAKQTNRQYSDKYLMPQETGTLYRRIKRQPIGQKLEITKEYLKESVGINIAPQDYLNLGSGEAADNVDSEGNTTDTHTMAVGKYPDGRQFGIIPQYYTRQLENPSQISADLIGMLQRYVKMSCRYNQRLEIRDTCEALVDFLENQHFRTGGQFSNKTVQKDSRTFHEAQKFMEMFMYDKKKTSNKLAKIASGVKNVTTAINLGLNPKVAAVGFLTSQYSHFINQLTGQKYTVREGMTAFREVTLHVLKNGGGLGYIESRNSNDKLQLLLERLDMMEMFEKKYRLSNRSKLINAINENKTFGFLTAQDYYSKAQIAVATVMSFRYVDGQFMSQEDIHNRRFRLGEEKYKRLLQKWKQGKSMYSVLTAKDGKLEVEDKYKKAYEAAEFIVKIRAQKFAEAADGMPTETQRAAVTQSWIGSFILIHRQFLPMIIQERFGERVYDYDTQMYKNGQFRTVFNIVRDLMQNNIYAGAASGAILGGAFGGPLGSLIGIGTAMFIRNRAHKYQKQGLLQKKSLKQLYNEHISKGDTEQQYLLSRSNKKNIKQVILELAIYNLLITPVVNLICKWADDDDEAWWKQMLAYIARSFQWESYTPYRGSEFMSAIKSPTASTSLTDKVSDLAQQATKSTINLVSPRGELLFDPSQNYKDLFNNEEDEDEDLVKRGAYKGWNKTDKAMFKFLPAHNLYEQVKNSKSKRSYMENQIMNTSKVDENDPYLLQMFR